MILAPFLALALAAFPPAAGQAPSPPPAVAPAQGGSRVTADELRSSMLASDSTIVIHVAVDWKTQKDSSGADRPVASTRRAAIRVVRRPWVSRFVANLLPAGLPTNAELCPLPAATDHNPRPWMASVLWITPRERGQVYADLENKCGFGGLAGRQPAGFSIAGREDSLRALVREVLASESPSHRSEAAAKPPGPEPAALDSNGLPAYGSRAAVDEPPRPLTRVAPEYPAEAQKAGVNGIVRVDALVGADGRVLDTRIARSVAMLDSAAVVAVRRWVFRPAMAGGKPVPAWVPVPVTFKRSPN